MNSKLTVLKRAARPEAVPASVRAAYFARRLCGECRAGHVANPDVVTRTYSYDAFGNRVLQTGTTTTFIYPLSGTRSRARRAQVKNIQRRSSMLITVMRYSRPQISSSPAERRPAARRRATFIPITLGPRTQ
jgi:hypothetical protein